MKHTNVVSFEDFKKQKAQKDSKPTHPRDPQAVLVWLHCPQCQNLEYTHILAPAGRMHHCGTQVLEKEIQLNLAVEYQVVAENLKQLAELKLTDWQHLPLNKKQQKLLHAQLEYLVKTEEIYKQKLEQCTNGVIPQPLLPSESWPIRSLHPLGLQITEFRHKPERHFGQAKS